MDHPYRVAAAPSGLACPRCDGISLTRRSLGHVTVDECGRCRGVFVSAAALAAIVDDIGLYDQVRTAYPVGPTRDPGGPMYIKCPRCTDVMNRRLFAPGAQVVVDVCRQHGTWFDPRELPAVVAFVEAGGLDRAARVAERAAVWSPPRCTSAPRIPVANERDVTMASALLELLLFWR